MLRQSKGLPFFCISMKGRFRLILILIILPTITANAQQQRLFARSWRPSVQQATIREFLEDINHRSGVIIEYSSNSIDTDKVVLLTGSPSTLGAVLQQVLRSQKIRVIEKNNKIILVPSNTPLPDDAFVIMYAVFGFIKEENSGEPLSDASIFESLRKRGTLSNQHGYYTLLLPEGEQTIIVTYTGHSPRQQTVNVREDTRLDIQLPIKPDISEVVISSDGRQKKEGADRVDADGFNNVIGEPDIMRSLYLLPGVKNISELPNGILVRGANPGENLFLMDGNPVFNPTHLLGSLPIVNRTSLKSMYLYKSNFPARYGGGLSSVMDVATKDGNMTQWKGEANAGVLAGSFTIEGPIKKDRTAMMLSFRQSWVNPFLKLIGSDVAVKFYDLQFKLTQLIGKKDKLMLNVYAGDDNLTMKQDNINNRHQWGNKNISLAWNRLLGTRAFINTAVNMSSYNNIAGFRYSLYDSTGSLVQNRVYNIFSSIQQYNLRSQLEVALSNNVRMNVGGRVSETHIKPFTRTVTEDFVDDPQEFSSFPTLSFREYVLFYENEIRAGQHFLLRPGLHFSHYDYNDFHYNTLQPRLYTAWRPHRFHQVSLSWSQMAQYLHLVTNPYLGVNSDAWVPATRKLYPEKSQMINLGYSYLNQRKILISLEGYYKQLMNVTNYVEGKNLFLNNTTWEQNIQSGKGWSYGTELMVSKKTDRWQAQLSYTLSWNWRQFKSVNKGNRFPYKYDRRHDLSAAATYRISNKWSASGMWTFATGDVFTLPSLIYPDFDDAQQIRDPMSPQEYRLIYHSTDNNRYRTPAYHRLDISVGYLHAWKTNIPAKLLMGIYNVYGAPSQYVYDLEGTLGKRSLVVTTRYQFFTITPYVSYTVSF